MKTRITLSLSLLLLFGATLWADAKKPTKKTSLSESSLGESQTLFWECGFTVDAGSSSCGGKVTLLVPQTWKEQKIELVSEEVFPKNVRITQGKGKRTVVIPSLPAGETAQVLFRYKIVSSTQKKPTKTSRLKRPDVKNLPASVKIFTKPDAFIVCGNREIKKLADEIGADASCVWDELDAVYHTVRERVAYQKGPLKGILAALSEGSGDCEELSALFVAICRAKKIPARTVWVPVEEIPGEYHCYAEFYLENKKGEGSWFPCQPAGDTELGEIPQHYVVLQKGESLTQVPNPETGRNETRPFMPVQMTVTSGRPSLSLVNQILSR